jgi:hypothetical protein
MRMCELCKFDRNDDEFTKCKQCGADMEPLEDEDDADTETAWFHYLHIPTIGIIELVPGRAFQIGRESRNELVIPKASADQVATFFWSEDYDEATIRENGAQEPVKVEGQRLEGTRTLKGGERIAVGPLDMKYLRREERIENAIDARRAGGSATNPHVQAMMPNAPTAPKAPGKRRRGAGPADVALALAKVGASGTLRIDTGKIRGFVTIVKGVPRHAAYGRLVGRQALDAILGLERAKCAMVPGIPARAVGEALQTSFASAIAALRGTTTARIQPLEVGPTAIRPLTPGGMIAPPPRPTPPPRTAPTQRTPAPRPAPPRPGTQRPAPPRPGTPRPAPTQRPTSPPPRPGAGAPPPRPAPRPGTPAPRPGAPRKPTQPPRRPPTK